MTLRTCATIEQRGCPTGVIEDARIELTSDHARRQGCTCVLRRIVYRDDASGEEFVYLTNNMRLAASTIARIYKDRWQIEAFFRALKQKISRSRLSSEQAPTLYGLRFGQH